MSKGRTPGKLVKAKEGFAPLRTGVKGPVSESCQTLCDPVDYQAPPSMGFSWQEYWSELPFPSPGDLPDPGIKPGSPTLDADALTSEPPGKPGPQIPFVSFFNVFGAQGRAQLVSKLQVHPPLRLQRWKAELRAPLKRLSRFLAGQGRADLTPGPLLLLQS